MPDNFESEMYDQIIIRESWGNCHLMRGKVDVPVDKGERCGFNGLDSKMRRL